MSHAYSMKEIEKGHHACSSSDYSIIRVIPPAINPNTYEWRMVYTLVAATLLCVPPAPSVNMSVLIFTDTKDLCLIDFILSSHIHRALQT